MEMNPVAPEITLENFNADELKRKTQFSGKVIKTMLAGAVIDIGLPVPGVLHISQLSTHPVNRVEDVISEGQTVDVWVRRVFPKKNRIELTMIKPLDFEWRELETDMVVKGKVVRLEKFGVFVDIGAERPGLVHISEIAHGYIETPNEVVKEGDEVEVKILNVNRQKKQIKLSMKALEEPPVKVKEEKKSHAAREAPKSPPVDETPKEDPIPTAMEIAFREAVERSNERQEETPVKSKKSTPDEMEGILNRTLENRKK